MKTIKQFASKKEFFNYLIANKKELIEFKKSVLKFCDAFGAKDTEATVIKGLNTNYTDDIASGVIKRTIIGNTYNWMDSHDDVHLDGVFAKSISERQDKIWHLHDHVHQLAAKVGKPISIYEKSVKWKDLGIEKTGSTMALFMDTNIMKSYNAMIFSDYIAKEINQHSVGMYYVNIDLAINDPESKEEFSQWNKYFNLIGNKEKAEEKGFFWAVKEAKLIEISGVLAGSNELTPTVENKWSTAEKQVCPSCGANVTPDDDGDCPECGEEMKAKAQVKSFYDRIAERMVI